MYALFVSTTLAFASLSSAAAAKKATAGSEHVTTTTDGHKGSGKIDYQALLEDYVYYAELQSMNGCKVAVEEGSYSDKDYIAVRNRNCMYVGFTLEGSKQAQEEYIAHTGVKPLFVMDRPQGTVDAFFLLEQGDSFGIMVGPEAGPITIKEITAEPLDLADVEAQIGDKLDKQYDAEHDCSYMIGTYFDEVMQGPTSAIINYDCKHLTAEVRQYEWEHDDVQLEYGPDFDYCEYSDGNLPVEECDLPTVVCSISLKPGQVKFWLGQDGDVGILDSSVDASPVPDGRH